jgi:hypothetical protein
MVEWKERMAEGQDSRIEGWQNGRKELKNRRWGDGRRAGYEGWQNNKIDG